MTVKAWFNNSSNNSSSSIKKSNKKKHQRQQPPTITTITAPLPPFSSPPPPYSHTITPSTSCSSSFNPSYSTPSSTLSSSFLTTNKKSPLRPTLLQPQQPQHQHSYSSTSDNEPTSPTSPRPYTLLVLPTTATSSSSSCSPQPIDNNLFISMTMNPRKTVPRPPAEFHIRSTTTSATYNLNKNSTATYSNTSSHLDKALPAPPKRALFKGLKTRLRSHSFSSSTFSFPTSSSQDHHHSVLTLASSCGSRTSSTVSATPESVAQEYARTIKSLWKMVEDEEQAHRLVEASHSLSGSIPTIADIVPGTRVVNRPPYVDTMNAAPRRPSLPLLMTVPPIQEEEETSSSSSSFTSTTSPIRAPFSPRPLSGSHRHHSVSFIALDKTPHCTTKPTNNATALVVSTSSNEMDDTVADLEVSPVGLSDASEEDEDYAEDSEEEEERAVVHVAQKISVYRGRSFCWSQPS